MIPRQDEIKPYNDTCTSTHTITNLTVNMHIIMHYNLTIIYLEHFHFLTLSRPLSHLCDGRSHFLSGPWAHVCDENKGFTRTPGTFLSYALSCWELYHSKEYTVPFPMTYDTVVGGIENFCEILIWSHVTQNVFGARGSLRQLCNVCLYGGGSLWQLCNVCVYGAKIFPVCLAFQGKKISSILSSCSFWRKNHTNQREVWFSKNILAVETFPPNCLHMCIFWGWKDRYTLHVNGSKQCGPGGLWLCEEMGLDRVNVAAPLTAWKKTSSKVA